MIGSRIRCSDISGAVVEDISAAAVSAAAAAVVSAAAEVYRLN